MRKLFGIIVICLIAGCASADSERFYEPAAAAECETGTGGVGQPPCKMTFWSSKSGFQDPYGEREQDD